MSISFFQDEKSLELSSMIVLFTATLVSGFSAFFANNFAGLMQSSYVQSVHKNSEAIIEYSTVLNDYSNRGIDNLKDDLLYYQRKNLDESSEDAQYLFSRFSSGLQMDIMDESDAKVSYIDLHAEAMQKQMEETFASYQQGIEEAEQFLAKGNKANEKGDTMTLISILMTLVLFLGGISASNSISLVTRRYAIMIGSCIVMYAILLGIRTILGA